MADPPASASSQYESLICPFLGYNRSLTRLRVTAQAELAQSADLVRESEYLSSPDPQSFSVLSLLARPFWWTLSTVLGASSSSSSSIEYGEAADQKEWTKRQGDYVVPDLVEVSLTPSTGAAPTLCAVRSTDPNHPTLQRAASQLTPKLDNLHADALSRLYTLKLFRDRLGPLCLPNVTLSERDCEVLATYLSRKGLCGFDGEVSAYCFDILRVNAAPNMHLTCYVPDPTVMVPDTNDLLGDQVPRAALDSSPVSTGPYHRRGPLDPVPPRLTRLPLCLDLFPRRSDHRRTKQSD